MGLKRRTFLQQAGLTLLALGASETALSLLGDKSFAVPLLDRYYQALAQPSARKLALLVGINQYPRLLETRNLGSLQGCVTDVELQRELLIHRFGFNPKDVITLTDQQATRENIETAFWEHLTQQAVEGDVVVFHFSGYGSRIHLNPVSQVNTDAAIDPSTSLWQNSLVPVDSVWLNKDTSAMNDLLEETLLLLLRSLKTDQVTTVLDTSYTDAGTLLQGNLRIRSRPEILAESINAAELAFQEQLRLRLNASPQQVKSLRNSNQMPGIVLTASAPTQAATEASWGGFSAGLFTYALTQNLWQATPPTTVQVSISRTVGVVEQFAGNEQQPQLSGQKSNDASLLAYNSMPDLSMGADGVVIAVEDSGKAVQLWLAGVPTTVLSYYRVNSLMTLLNSQPIATAAVTSLSETSDNTSTENPPLSSQPMQLQIRAREGLTARARMVTDPLETARTPLQVGQLVQESVRVLPRHIGLTIALNTNLERIERVDATSAFASIVSVSSVVTAGEQPADYLFGKLSNLPTKGDNASVQESGGGYGLFFAGGDPIPNTVGEPGEAIKSAVNRLRPRLRTLLAAKLLRLTANEGSSRLGIRATLEMLAPVAQALMQRETLRAPFTPPQKGKSQLKAEGVPKLAIGSRIQYRVENYSDRPVYLMLLGLDSSSSAIALYPLPSFPEVDAAEAKPLLKNTVIPPGQILTIPQQSASFEWLIQGSPGLAEVYLICSTAPFTQAIAALEAAMRPKGERERIGDLFNPLDVARAVLQDLHQASLLAKQNPILASPLETSSNPSDSYAFDVNAWATLNFIYQVV